VTDETQEEQMARRITCFEDYRVGEKGETSGRTITEADLVHFAGLTGDFCPAHVDRDMMMSSSHGERLAHGFFVNSLVVGFLSWHAPYLTGRDIPNAYLRSLTSRFPEGIGVGDTVRFHWSIVKKAEDPDLPGFGVVKTDFRFINQGGGISAEGTVATGVRMRDAADVRPPFTPGPAWEYEEWVSDFDKVHFYEDFKVGTGEKSGGRVVTEADVVSYMALVGDYDRLYTDPVYSKETLFGEVIVPPMLVVDYMGLYLRDGSYFNLKRAFSAYQGHLGDEITFIAPARIGDVLYAIVKIESARISKTKPDRGILVLAHQLVNQRDEALAEIRLATTIPVRAANKIEPKETMWVMHTIK
jgi:acyl dehydratase